MGRIGTFIGAILLVCSLCGFAWAIPISYSDTENFYSPDNVLSGMGTFSWLHNIPADFSLPPDTINDASLVITSRRAANNNDLVYIVNFESDFLLGSLNATGNSPITTTFDLETLGVFSAGWSSGQTLNMSLLYDQNTGQSNTLTMVSSIFYLNYENGTSDGGSDQEITPVPEPSTVILLGSGLLGLFYTARRRNKQ